MQRSQSHIARLSAQRKDLEAKLQEKENTIAALREVERKQAEQISKSEKDKQELGEEYMGLADEKYSLSREAQQLSTENGVLRQQISVLEAERDTLKVRLQEVARQKRSLDDLNARLQYIEGQKHTAERRFKDQRNSTTAMVHHYELAEREAKQAQAEVANLKRQLANQRDSTTSMLSSWETAQRSWRDSRKQVESLQKEVKLLQGQLKGQKERHADYVWDQLQQEGARQPKDQASQTELTGDDYVEVASQSPKEAKGQASPTEAVASQSQTGALLRAAKLKAPVSELIVAESGGDSLLTRGFHAATFGYFKGEMPGKAVPVEMPSVVGGAPSLNRSSSQG